ncbi:ATP-binding protein [uncultured Chryseobacterium sp.]|uniref:ATP-binding protein n=1 Tax=uncultured Chryseobacterium sp. TaxID=259322 RepID=UPI0025E35E75|nr:ATP-binding protein [uncultured Chryseobacterium sp.]
MANIHSAEELKRLVATYDSDAIIDTEIKKLAELAAAICHTPAALVSFTGNADQWVTSQYGIKVNHVDLYHSFCKDILPKENDLVLIDDLHSDTRFSSDPFVQENKDIRFFACIPFRDSGEKIIGFLSVIDDKSGTLNDFQKKALHIAFDNSVDVSLLYHKINDKKNIQDKTILSENANNSRESFKNIIEQFPAAIIIFRGPDLIIDIVNSSMLALLDKEPQIIGLPLLEAIPELLGQPAFELLQNIYRTGKPVQGNETAVRLFRNGRYETGYFNFTYAPLYENGEIIGIIDMAVEVTEQINAKSALKESEEQLRESNRELVLSHENLVSSNQHLTETEELLKQANLELVQNKDRLQSILDAVKEGIGITDHEGNIVYTNERAREILKIDSQSILKRKNSSSEWFNRRLDGSLMPHEEHPVSKAIATGKTIYNQIFLVQADGEPPLYLHMNATPLFGDGGVLTGAIGSFSDITESYLLQQKLKEKEESLSMAISSADLGTWYINAETREFYPSSRLKELFGYYADEEMPYVSALIRIAPSHRKEVIDAVEATIAKGRPFDMEYPVIGYHDKKLRWVHATGKLYANINNPEVSHFSGTMADITERKLDEQRRSDFIGMVSHELRNPLTAIGAYIHLLGKKAQKNNDQMVSDTVIKLSRQVKRMEALINGFLEVARLGEGKIRLNRLEFDMADLVRIAEEESLATITSHQVVFAPVEFTPVEADKDKIEQVLVNFINNAVKYSPEGSTINVACVTKNNMAYVSVTDKGMGIPEKDQPFIFDRFYRVESEDMKNKKGFGIGLYICKEIIERHNGQIGLESIEGQGSTFWFTIPVLI